MTASSILPAAGLLPDSPLWADPYKLYAMLRSTNPVFRAPIPDDAGAGVWILTRHAEVETTLRDPDGCFSVDRMKSDVARAFPDRLPRALLDGPSGGLRTMLLMDPPDHTRIRGLVSKAFTPRRIEALHGRIEALVTQLLDDVESRETFDVIRDFAEPLPAIVIAELLGVPPEDHRQFKQWSSDLISALPQSIAGETTALDETVNILLDYLREVIAGRRAEPRDDLISGMIAAQEERDALSDSELVSTSFLLLLAGHETTTNLIGNGLYALLRQREQWERLRDERSLLANGVEELLRFDSPVQATVRVVKDDVEFDGKTLASGALVVCGIGAANRDPARYDNPDEVDVAREDVRHLSLGFGAHFCLGAPLARLEAKLAFDALLDRFPALRLAGEDVTYRANPVLRGLTALPVAPH